MSTMRKDCRNVTKATLNNVQGYHQGGYGYGDCEAYAFAGFKSNKYFTSDRFVALDSNHQRTDGKPIKGFGLEIETECYSVKEYEPIADIMQQIIFKMFPDDLFKLQYDSSLGVEEERDSWGDVEVAGALGVECITQIMTKQFIRNHYKDFKTMYDTYFRHFKISCSDSGNCGMHVNVSNAVFGDNVDKQKDTVRKLHYFINKNYSFACDLFKRDEDRTDYCGEMYYGNKEYCKTMELDCGSHGTCMNYSHFNAGRVEIRIVGGQHDYNAFRNTMETVFFLCEKLKKVSWDDLDDMVKVFSGCNQYVYKRLNYCHLPYETLYAIRQTIKEEDLELA